MSTEGTKALVLIRNAIGCCLVLCNQHCNNGEKTRIRLSHLFLFDSGSCSRKALRLRNRQPFRKYTKYKHLPYFDLSTIRTHWYPLEHIGTFRNRGHSVILHNRCIYFNVLFSIEQVQLVYLIRNVLVDVYNSMCCSLLNKQQCISNKERMNRCIYFYLLFSTE